METGTACCDFLCELTKFKPGEPQRRRIHGRDSGVDFSETTFGTRGERVAPVMGLETLQEKRWKWKELLSTSSPQTRVSTTEQHHNLSKTLCVHAVNAMLYFLGSFFTSLELHHRLVAWGSSFVVLWQRQNIRRSSSNTLALHFTSYQAKSQNETLS